MSRYIRLHYADEDDSQLPVASSGHAQWLPTACPGAVGSQAPDETLLALKPEEKLPPHVRKNKQWMHYLSIMGEQITRRRAAQSALAHQIAGPPSHETEAQFISRSSVSLMSHSEVHHTSSDLDSRSESSMGAEDKGPQQDDRVLPQGTTESARRKEPKANGKGGVQGHPRMNEDAPHVRPPSLLTLPAGMRIESSSPLMRMPVVLDDEMDEPAGDTNPCFPSAMLRNPNDETQQTQTLSTPRLRSSPSVIEAPAFSSFRQASQLSPENRLAPARTVRCPPPKPQNARSIPAERPSPILIISDDDDDDEVEPPRGDIQLTAFKAQIQSSKSSDSESFMKQKMRQIYDVLGSKTTALQVREALGKCENEVENAIALLESRRSKRGSKITAHIQPKNGKEPIQASSPKVGIQAHSPSVAPPPRRRLVRGLGNRGTSPALKPTSQKPSPQDVKPPSGEDPLIIVLSDDDVGDACEAEDCSPSPELEASDRVWDCIGTRTQGASGHHGAHNRQTTFQRPLSSSPGEQQAEARREKVKRGRHRRAGGLTTSRVL